MDTNELFRDLYLHMEWADALVWSTVLPASSLADDASVRERLYHLHMVQRAFLHIWRGEKTNFSGTEGLRAEDLARWGRAYHLSVRPFLASLSASQLDAPVRLPWAAQIMERFGTGAVDPRLGETVLQVAMHSTHHRGQVNARIRELGTEPPLTDYIAWLWSSRPKASWPEGTEEGARLPA